MKKEIIKEVSLEEVSQEEFIKIAEQEALELKAREVEEKKEQFKEVLRVSDEDPTVGQEINNFIVEERLAEFDLHDADDDAEIARRTASKAERQLKREALIGK